MSEKRDAYVAKMKTKLDTWNKKIDSLEEKGHQIGADSRAEFQTQMGNLRAKRDEAKEKLEGLRRAGEDAWRDLRDGIDSSWKSLDEAVRRAAANFKQTNLTQEP